MTDQHAARQDANRRLARRLAVVCVAMFGFGFAMVPLYDVFCRVVGIGGKPSSERAVAGSVVQDRWVTVEFTGNTMPGASWEFRPEQTRMRVHPGELVVARYVVRNPTNETLTGQAVPAVTPPRAAPHFKKLDCFCFTEQAFKPGETRELPVTFQVSPDLPDDVRTITLSYAFFNAPSGRGG